MQIYFDWVNVKKYGRLVAISMMFMSGYTILSGQSNENVNHYPQFVVVRLASFDFFGEPEIEVIIEDAEVRPPVGSGVIINPSDVIDEYEKDSAPVIAEGKNPTPALKESNPFPSAEVGSASQRETPQGASTHSHSVFNDGDRRSTEEKIRGWNKNAEPRPLPDPAVESVGVDIMNSEIINSKDHEAVSRKNPDRVALISLAPTPDPIKADDEKTVSEDDYKVIDAPRLDHVNDNSETMLPNKEFTSLTEAEHPWGDLPLVDQEFLVPYWQENLETGFYIQVFATIQPLKLRPQIDRYAPVLPLVITATYGRLGTMNRLLIGPLKSDELGAVGMELRLQGVRDYFLVTVSQ